MSIFQKFLILLLFLPLFFSPAHAATCTWNNGSGDNMWSTTSNWSCGTLPGSGDDVVFNGTSTANCYYNTISSTIASITMTSAYTGRFEWGYAAYGRGIRGMYFSDNAYTGGTYSRVDATVNFASDWSGSMPSGIDNTNTRVIWHAYVVPQYSEAYTFYETSDDGGRLWVNGVQIINQWADGGMTEYSGTTATLTAGVMYDIKYEMYNAAGASGAILNWSSPSQAKQLIPQTRQFPDHNGLRSQWWQGTDLTGTTGTDATAFVDFNWGGAGPDQFFTGDDFSAEFQGFIIPQYTETYTFYTSKDDGARLYVNDALIIDSWNCCGEPTGTITLVAGVPYYIDLSFRDTGGSAELHFSWSSASQAKQIVPVERMNVPYWLLVTGTADFRSGGVVNFGGGELQFTGGSAQTFYPKSGTKFNRIVQNGAGGTTISTNDLTVSYLEVRSGTLNLGTGRSVTPDYFKANGGTLNFNTSTLNLSQNAIDFSTVGSATSGAAGSVLALTNNSGNMTTLTGTVTGSALNVTVAGTGNTTISGNLANGTGSLTKTGSGTLTLTGTDSQTGNLTVSAGTLNFTQTAGQTFNFGVITNNATINFDPTALAYYQFYCALSGSGTWNIDGPGSGTVLENRVNFRGNATASDNTGPMNVINGGKMWMENSSGQIVVGTSVTIDVAASATLSPCGTGTRSIGGITGSGTVDLSYTAGGTPTLSIGNGNVSSAFSGVIKNSSGSLPIVKTGSGTFSLSGANTYTGSTTVTGGTLAVTAGSVIGTQSLILNNGGNMTIAGTVTLATDATGVFGVGYGATGTSTLTLNTGGALNVGNGGGRTFVGGGPSGGPYGTGILTIAGGTMTVAAAGAFPNDILYVPGYGGTGTVNLNGGILLTSRSVQRGAGTASFFFNGGTFRTGATFTNHLTGIQTVEVRNGGAIFDGNGFTLGVYNQLVHSTQGGDNATDGGVTTTGSGTVALYGTLDSYTGATTIGTGTILKLGAAGVIPDADAVTATGTLDMGGFSETIGSLAGGGTVENSTGAGTYTLTTNGSNANTVFSGILQNTSGSLALTKSGTGELQLQGASTFSGGTTINGGWVNASNNASFGTGTVTVNANAFAMLWSPSGLTIANNWVLNGSSGNTSYPTLCHDGGGGAVTLNGNISVTAASEIGMGGTTSNTMTINGVISGSGNITIDEANGGSSNTLVFAGANTFSGTLTVQPGVLRLGASNVIPDGVAVTDNATTGGIDLYGHSETIGSLAGTGIVDNNAATAGTFTLTTGGDNTSTTFSGVLKNTQQTLALTKAGTGTLILSGTNTYSGLTTVSAGILKLGNTAALGATTNGTSITSGAVLDLNGINYASAEALTINGTGISSGGAVTNSNATAATYAGLLTLGSASSIIAGTGTITISNAGTITGAGLSLTLGGAQNGSLASIVGTTTGNIIKQGAGNWTLTGASTYTGGTDMSGGTLTISAANNLGAPSIPYLLVFSGNSSLAVTSSFSTSKEVYLNNSVTGTFDIAANQTLTANGELHSISGAPIHKTGTGTLLLGVANPQLDNDLYLDAGTLDIRNVGAIGNVQSTDFVYAAAGTTIRLTSDANMDVTGSIQAEGTGVNIISDRLTSGAGVTHSIYNYNSNGAYTSNFSAGSNVASGTQGLTIRNGGTLVGHSVLDVTDPGTPDILLTWAVQMLGSGYNLTVQGTGNTTISGVIQTGAGTLTKAGSGTLLLSGNNTFTGAVSVNAGILQLGHATGALGTSAGGVTVNTGGALDLNGINYSTAEALTLNSTGVSSGGAMMNSSATGATYAGLITLGSASSILGGTGTIAVSNVGTITGATYGLTLGGASGGTLTSILGTTSGTLTKLDAGTWTLSGANTYTGATTVSAGTLKLNNSAALGTTAAGTTVSSGATLDLNAQAIGSEAMSITGTGVGTNGALINSNGSAASWAGDVTITANPCYMGGSGDFTLSGATTTNTITKIGAGTLTLSGTTDNNAMTLVANAGNVVLAKTSSSSVHAVGGSGMTVGGAIVKVAGTGGDQIFNNVIVTVNSGTLDLNGNSESFYAVAGSGGTVDNTSGAGTYTLTFVGPGSYSYSGTIQNTSGTLALSCSGAGTYTWSGNNTYSGTTTVASNTTLKVGSATALGAITGATTVSSGGVLDLNGITYTNVEPLTISGTGISSGGALMNSSSTGATFAGLVTLGSASSIIGGTGTIALSNAGTITGATFGLTLGGAQGGSIESILGTTNGTLNKQDAGTWTLNGTSTRTGQNTFTAGTLVITTTSGMGTGNTTLNNATLQVLVNGAGNNGTITVGNLISTNSGNVATIYVANNGANTGNTVAFGTYSMSNGTLNATGANGYAISFGAMTLNGGSSGTAILNPTTADLSIASITGNNNAHTLQLDGTGTGTITGAIADGSAAVTLTRLSAGTWTLAGANTYTGTTTVSAGTLNVIGSTSASSAVTVASGATLAGTGTVAGTTTISAGGILSPGNTGIGTLSTGAQVLNNTSVINYTLGATSDKVAVTGNFTLDGTVNVTAGTGFTFGTYTLMTYSGSLTNNTLNVGTLPAGYYGTITAGSGVVTLNLADYSGWNYISTINFNTTSTGANVANNVTSFPMLVRLDSNNFFFDQAMPDGRDIRFSDPDGTALPYEIERWDATLKKAEIWVLVPQVDGNSDRDFMNMYWGNASATSQSSSTGVFPSSGGFGGVWHLNAAFADASSNANNGANTNSTDTAGIIGRARWFATGSSQYVEMPYSSTLNLSSFTFSAWTKVQTLGAERGIISSRFGSDNTFDAQWDNGTQGLHGDIGNGTTWLTASADYANTPASGVWNYVTWTATTNAYNVYLNGVLVTPGVIAGTPQFMKSGETLRIGQTKTSGYFSGAIDEPRVDNVVRSADWIKLSYATQRANTTALVYPNSALSTFAYSNKVYVNTSASGANTATDVTSFPMLVRLTAGNFNFSQAKTDGSDLRFADSTGALLPYELGRFDATNKLAEAWVLLPTVKANNNSQWFRMYWGKPSASSLSSANSVWQNSNGHVGAYHLNEASGTVYDATSNANNGTFNGNVPNQQNGIIGKAHLFDGNGDFLDMGTNSTLDFSANDRITVSAWVNRSGAAVAGPDEGIVSKIEWSASNDRSWNLVHKNSSLGFRFAVSTDGTSGNETFATSNYQATNATWYHVVGVADGTKIRIYVNGVERGNSAFSGNIFYSANSTLKIGENDDDAGSNRQYWNGYIDEVNVSNVARSADWIKLAYETQKAAATAVSLGSRPTDFTNSLRLNFNTTATGANVTGTDVTNIPILVRLSSSNFDFSKTLSGGTDLQFIDKDGTYLYHEVVEWDRSNSVGKVWVKVPQVDKNSNSDYITLYYGCATCMASPYALSDSVFTGYKAMYHLNGDNESRGMDATVYKNVIVYNNATAITAGLTTPQSPYFDGTATSNASVSDPAGGEQDMGTADFTISCWFKSSQVPAGGVWPSPVSKVDQPGNLGWDLNLDQAGGTAGKMYFQIRSSAWATSPYSSVALNDGAWHFVAGKKTATTVELFVDGVSQGTTAHSLGTISNAADLTVAGAYASSNSRFQGNVGEVGLARSALSADFIKLSYENQKATSTLFSATTITTSSFQKSKVFKFNTTASGANVAGDVYNFPVLIRLTGATVINATQANAPDIRFLDGDGVTWLDYEIERWNQSVDSAEIWVKVPKVEGNTSGDFITLYYQQAAGVTVPDGQCASCVFGTDNNFVAAWHLNTSGTGARPNSVSGGNSLTTSGYEGDEYMIGNIATSDNLDGTNDYLNLGSGYADFTAGLTYSIWAYPTANSTWGRFFDLGNGQGIDNINFTRFGGTSDLTFENWNNTTSGGYITATGAITNNTWQHFVVTMDPQLNVKIYKNGSLVQSGTSTNAIRNITRTSAFIGHSNWAADAYYAGRIDEPEISKVVRDSNWIKLAYQNQRTDATPLFNPSVTDFQKSKKFTFNTTRTGANVMGDVTNFPMLIRFTDVDGGLLSLVQSGAPDIRFLDGDGKTWLNYQIERWSTATSPDSAEIWVNVPKVDGNSDHDFITMYYQQASGVTVADGQCASCVFGNYKAVYHLNESPGGAAPQFTDASGNGNNGTAQAGVAGDQVSANSGNGFQLDGSSKYVSTTTAYPNAYPFTVSSWFKTSFSGAQGDLIGMGSAITGTSGNTDRILYIHTSGKVGAYTYDGSGHSIFSNATYTDGQWHQAVMRQSNSTYRGTYLFVDGAQVAGDSTLLTSFTYGGAGGYWRVGHQQNSSVYYFNGTMDEAQISHTELSNDYIKLNYETQRRSGNLFWNTRPGPNNTATLTATAYPSTATTAGAIAGSIALSWTSTVSDSSNADSVGIWVRYAGYPDSVGSTAVPASHVVTLAKTDTTYSYPASYPGTYYFALAVRNTSGKWSPYSKASSDTANQNGNAFMIDTVYVDSALGSDANSCVLARSPFTPKLTITSALTCGSNAIDTLVVRAMPGTYPNDNVLSITSKPSVVTSFDNNSRAVFNGSTTQNDGFTVNATVILNTDMILRNMDVKAAVNDYIGIYLWSTGTRSRVEGCRIYNNGNIKHHEGITWVGGNDQTTIANNLIYQPLQAGIYCGADNSFNILNNVFIGNATSTYAAINHVFNTGWTDMTVKNNIIYNWDYGIKTVAANIGVVSNNLFYQVTSAREVTGTSDANKIIKDPLFANMTLGNPNAFKLLPGSPAIDAGTTSYASGGVYVTYRIGSDYYGNARTIGTAPDIGLYEGSGYTPNPTGDFDTLQTSSTATTLTIKNSKWKLVFDKAVGSGISFFSDMSDSTTNLVASSSTLFDAKIGSYTASAVSSPIAPVFLERNKTRVVVRQWLTVSTSLNLNIYYTIYASGHIYIESEIANIGAGSTALTSVDYKLKLATTTSAYGSGGTTKGFGYLTTATRDALLSVTSALDGGAATAETWTSTAASGSPGTVVFATANPSNSAKYMKRYHRFLLYIGDAALDYQKSAALNTDAFNPSVVTTSSGSLLLERTWQDALNAHWTLDDGAGTTARDKAVYFQNNATLFGAGARWVSGKVGGGLYLTTTDTARVLSSTTVDAFLGGTYMFWLKPDFTNMGSTAFILSKGTTTSDGWYFRRSASNTVTFNMGAASAVTPALTDGVWTHLAAVVKPASAGTMQIELYVNGVMVSASSGAATAVANSTSLLFGNASGGNNNFQGTLDDIRIFNNEIYQGQIQAVYNQGFESKSGDYALRADNNNRMVALLNGGAAETRVQPAFTISNWYGPKTPKYVYLNGVRLKPNTDFVVDSIGNSLWGATLVLQLNKILTGADQTLFVDDDDSTGFMGRTSLMKSLSITATANDKIAIKNFTDTVFGGSASGQWYTELDLNGWTTNTSARVVDTGFGGFNVWKAAAINPNVAVSSSTNLVAIDANSGRQLVNMKFDNGATNMYGGGTGYLGPANITYTINDSSSTRLSLTLTNMSLSATVGTATLSKRWTIYPSGRIIGSWVLSSVSANLGDPDLDVQCRYNTSPSYAFGQTYADNNARAAWYGGDLAFHSLVGGVLSVKNNNGTFTGDATTRDADMTSYNGNSSGTDYRRGRLKLTNALYNTGIGNITTNFFVDIGKDFTDSATADSMAADMQNPAVLTAITGTRVTNDALDFNGDNFAEGDGAYTYAAAGTGVAHFKFANTVTCFNPAFRISSWTFGTLPEYVIVDNQTLTKGYHYNASLNTATNELILQFNKTYAPGTHVFYISHKTGLAVTLRSFEAKGGEGVDTLEWSTESEFENLGYNVYRRVAATEGNFDSSMAVGAKVEGAGIANAILDAARASVAAKAAAKLAKAKETFAALTGQDSSAKAVDTLPSMVLTPEELAALGYERLTSKLIPGAPGGASASTQQYRFLDRTAAFSVAYEYLLESTDFGGSRQQFGPRIAKPTNPLLTELYPNYPNPFNPITTLHFSLKDKAVVSLIIYDGKGKVVRTLLRPDKPMAPGKYRLIWDAKNEAGIGVPSGQYFYRLTAPHYIKTRKMILVK